MTIALKIPDLTDAEIAHKLHVGFLQPLSAGPPRPTVIPSFFDREDEPRNDAHELFASKNLGRRVLKGQGAPVIFSLGGKPFLRAMDWGFVPYWTQESERPHPLTMADVREAHHHLPFKESFYRRRCLVPAHFVNQLKAKGADNLDLFEGVDGVDESRPVATPEGIEFLAGVWDTYKRADGKTQFGFALLGHRDADGSWQALRVPRADARLWIGHQLGAIELHKKLMRWNGLELAPVVKRAVVETAPAAVGQHSFRQAS